MAAKNNNVENKFPLFLIPEKSQIYECTNEECKWQGTHQEKDIKKLDDFWTEDICPNCENNEFYKIPNKD